MKVLRYRTLLSILSLLLLHQAIGRLAGLSLGRLLLGALGLLRRAGLSLILVATIFSSGLALATFLGLSALGLGRLALL